MSAKHHNVRAGQIHPYISSQPQVDACKKQSCSTTTKSFANKLRKLKFASYRDYLLSDHWKAFKEAYRRSGLPRQCIVCGNSHYSLHHRTYTRLGREQLGDVIPLCEDCHKCVHAYERANPTNIQGTHKILRVIFGWSKEETRRRFAPFSINGGKSFSWVNHNIT